MRRVTVSLKTEMSFSAIKQMVWDGAEKTIARIEEAGKQEEFMDLLNKESSERGGLSFTDVNDLLWFEDDFLYDVLGIDVEEDEE